MTLRNFCQRQNKIAKRAIDLENDFDVGSMFGGQDDRKWKTSSEATCVENTLSNPRGMVV